MRVGVPATATAARATIPRQGAPGQPLREGAEDEVITLGEVIGRLSLVPCSEAIAELAVALSARYGLRAADAVHLATAVDAGADRFITHNARDFTVDITEIAVVRPAEL